MSGEAGTLMFWSEPNRLFKQTLEKMKTPLAESGYIGYIDINSIVNGRGIYPLEFTARFGFPTIQIQLEGILTPTAEWLYKLASGEKFELKTKRGFQVGVRVFVPTYFAKDKDIQTVEMYRDLPILFKKQNELNRAAAIGNHAVAQGPDGIHIEDIKNDNGVWRIAGTSGVLLVVTGSGSTVHEARRQAYIRIQNIMIPNMFYRVDIGHRWLEDSDKLQTWGYLDTFI